MYWTKAWRSERPHALSRWTMSFVCSTLALTFVQNVV